MALPSQVANVRWNLTPPPALDPHAYFNGLILRPDLLHAYSLRPIVGRLVTDPYYEKQLLRTLQGGYAQTNNLSVPFNVTYDPVGDSYPQKQDAAKVWTPAGGSSITNQVRLPIHTTSDVLITWDAWWGEEYRTDLGAITTNKSFQIGSGATSGGTNTDHIWWETRSRFSLAQAGNLAALDFRDNAPSPIGSNMTSADPASPFVPFQLKSQTWTRYWEHISYSGGRAFVSVWVADITRNPTQVINGLNFSEVTDAFNFWIEFNTSQTRIGGGPLTAYVRNVSMHAMPVGAVPSILERPI